MIIFLLGLIRLEFLVLDYSVEAESMHDTLELVIKWLQVSVIVCNHRRSNPQTKNPICV